MKPKTFTMHSHRGGSGKSVIASSIALELAARDYNVVLVDMDLRAPSLYYIFHEPPVKYWINDYLENECSFEETLVNLSEAYGLRGTLSLSLANPDIDAIKETLTKTRRWEMNALKKLVRIRKIIGKLGYHVLIYDTSPGVHYSALNTLIASDNVVLVVVPDNVDIKGALSFIREIYDAIKMKAYLIVNKIPTNDRNEAQEIARTLADQLKIPLLGAIPYYHEVVKYNGLKHMVLELPQHPYVADIRGIVNKILA